jgi:hypothetical protein
MYTKSEQIFIVQLRLFAAPVVFVGEDVETLGLGGAKRTQALMGSAVLVACLVQHHTTHHYIRDCGVLKEVQLQTMRTRSSK